MKRFHRNKGWLAILPAVALALMARGAVAQTVRTIIGPANEDGLPATRVMLHAPMDMALDATGALYVLENGADVNYGVSGPAQVRRITPDGTISRVVAPRLMRDIAEAPGPARVEFGFALGVEVDQTGSLYVADGAGDRIWQVDRQGKVAEFARSGLNGPRGMAVDGEGNLYVADRLNHRVRRVSPDGSVSTVAGTGSRGFSGDAGPASQARLNDPHDVAVDLEGNVYIADTGNRRLRRVDREGIIETVRAGLGPIRRIAPDRQGSVYFSTFWTHEVRKVTPDGQVTLMAGDPQPGFSGDGGPATQARLNMPIGLLVDDSGNLLIADTVNGRIRRVAPDGTITTIAGGGDPTGLPASQVSVFWPLGGIRDAQGNTYVVDTPHARILKIDPEGIVTRIAGTGVPGGYMGEGLPATEVSLGNVEGASLAVEPNVQALFRFNVDNLALDTQGNLYIPDVVQGRVYKLDRTGILTTAAGNGRAGFSGDGGPASEASLSREFWNVAVDAQGNLYIADAGNRRVRRVNPDGIITTVAGDGSTRYRGDGGLATETGLRSPDGLAVDGAGNLYIGDTGHHRIFKVTPGGTISTVAGTGVPGSTGDGGEAAEARIDFPGGLAVDKGGNIYFADQSNHRIRRVTPAGIITTAAGTGQPGFNGDGMAPLETNITYPSDLYIDAAGNLIVAEWQMPPSPRTLISHRVRLITLASEGEGQDEDQEDQDET